MAQHLLIGDLAPLVVVLALRGTVRRVVSPFLTWPLWLADLAVWHVPVVYEAALHHEAVHAVEHVALFAGGLLLWTPVFGLAATPGWFGDAARLVYLLLTMFAGVVIGALFLWWPHAIYSTYAHAGGFAGLSPHADQRAGGGLMLLEGTIVIFAVAGWVVWRITSAEPSAQRSL
jgi:cytochrome c oxidase assembly factor CtaG